jgi:hypothetical protein
MLIFGLLGTLSPPRLHQEMLGTTAEAAVHRLESQPETAFYMVLFAVREILMAAWLILAAMYADSKTCKLLLYSVLLVLMPAESYLWMSARSYVAADIVNKQLTNQAVFVVYLVVAAVFGK